MVKKVKVLVSGIGQSNFIDQLYSSINKNFPEKFEFDILGLRPISNESEKKSVSCFKNQYPIQTNIDLRYLFLLFKIKFLKEAGNLIRFGASLSFIKFFIRNYLIFGKTYKNLSKNKYDLVHFHFPTKEKISLFWHLDNNQKYIVSFWGSDLMRVSGVFDYYIQNKILKNAQKITTHSIELKEQILTKFGRKLEEKVIITRFPPEEKLYRLIDQYLPDVDLLKPSFETKFNIPEFKDLIVIGHNGSKENNHIHILNQLSRIQDSLKEKYYFLLPFTYKNSKDEAYKKEIISILASNNLSGQILDKFLSWEDLALLKLCTKVYIHLPISDALSGSLTESIYAGSNVITGNWLPYSPFKEAGLKYYSINDFPELSKTFELAVSNKVNKVFLNDNQRKIKEYFFPDVCANTWLKAFVD
jgi:hypothetical protein